MAGSRIKGLGLLLSGFNTGEACNDDMGGIKSVGEMIFALGEEVCDIADALDRINVKNLSGKVD